MVGFSASSDDPETDGSGQISSHFHDKKGCLCQRMPIERIIETQDIARENLKNMLIDIVKEVSNNGGVCDFILGPNKKLDVARNKANRDYDGDITRVTDFVRAKIVVVTPEQVEGIKSLMSGGSLDTELTQKHGIKVTEESDTTVTFDTPQKRPEFMQHHNCEVARQSDFFEDPKDFTGYRCINYKLAVPVGKDSVGAEDFQIVELQIVAEQIEAVYDKTHPYKRAAEEILDKEGELTQEDRKRAAYNFAACRYHNGLAARDAGYDKLLKPEVRSKIALTRNRELKLEGMIDKLNEMGDPSVN